MSNNDWTITLRNKLADHQESARRDLWAGIEQSLASSSDSKEYASSSDPKKYASSSDSNKHNGTVISLRRWYVAAAAAAVLGVGGSYVYLHHSDSDSVLASKEVVSQEKRSHVFSKVASALHSVRLSGSSVASSPGAMVDLQSTSQPASIHNINQGKIEREESEDVLQKLADADYSNPIESYSQSASNLDNQSASSLSNQSVSTLSNQSVSQSDNNSLALAEKRMPSTSASLDHPDVERNLFAARNSDITPGWTMKLYAENLKPSGLDGFSSSGDFASNPSSGTLADPMPGVVANPANGENGINYLLASYRSVQNVNQAEAKHHAPVSVGIQVAFGVAPRLSVSTGVVYTRTSSDFKPYYSNDYDIHQVLHYVGVPVGVNYEFWRSNGFHTYVMAGVEVDLNVKNDSEDNGEKLENVKRDRPQFSGKASLGAQYDITPKVGLYIEPGAKYYFDNGSDVQNTFKDKKLNFNLQFGLRFNL